MQAAQRWRAARCCAWMLAYALLLAAPAPARAGYSTGPAPGWIEPALQRHGREAVGVLAEGQDRVYLLIEDQLSLHGPVPEHYHRSVVRILRHSAIADHASLRLQVSPGFEQLRIHGIAVRRDGERLDRLASARIDVLQRELRLDQGLIDDQRTVHVVLEDIRVGDEIDLAWSRSGVNPALGPLFARRLAVARPWPVLERIVQVDAPAGRQPHVRLVGAGLDADAVADAAATVRRWRGHRLPAAVADAEAPAWFSAGGYLDLSSAEDWAAVVRWALPLYRPEDADGSVAAQAAAIRSGHASREARLLAAVRLVQDQVRYTGIAIDERSFVPHPPAQVLRRRYGDCKDKTLLLLALLRDLGIEAVPALVSTTGGARLDRALPSPFAFDHVIARVTLDGRDYWIDATAELQRGTLANFAQADFGHALVLAEDSAALTAMPAAVSSRPELLVEETWDLRDRHGRLAPSGRLTIVTTYWRSRADRVRRDLQRSSPDEIGRHYLNFLLGYTHAKLDGPPQWQDDELANTVVVTERYRLPQPWDPVDEERQQAGFTLSLVHSSLDLPFARIRSSPLALAHPVHVEQRIKVLLDPGWPQQQSDFQEDNERFSVHHGVRLGGDKLVIRGHYRSRAADVDPAQVPAHLRAVIRARNNLGYTLTTARPSPAAGAATAAQGTVGAIISTLFNTPAPAPDGADAPGPDEPPAPPP